MCKTFKRKKEFSIFINSYKSHPTHCNPRSTVTVEEAQGAAVVVCVSFSRMLVIYGLHLNPRFQLPSPQSHQLIVRF